MHLRSGNFGDNKSVDSGIYELRIQYGPGYRIYYGRTGKRVIILLCGGDKSTQKKILRKPKFFGGLSKKQTKEKTMKKFKNYKEHLFKRLQDPKAAAAYLNAALEDKDPQVFLIALKDIADANGGITKLAKEAGLNRESLYRTLSSRGNPRLQSLLAILQACHLDISIRPTAA